MEQTKQRIAELEQQLYNLKEAFRQATNPIKQELHIQRQHLQDLKVQHTKELRSRETAYRQQQQAKKANRTERGLTAKARELHNSVVFTASQSVTMEDVAALEGITVEQVRAILKEEELHQARKEIIASHERYIPDEVILRAYDISQQELDTILGRSSNS